MARLDAEWQVFHDAEMARLGAFHDAEMARLGAEWRAFHDAETAHLTSELAQRHRALEQTKLERAQCQRALLPCQDVLQYNDALSGQEQCRSALMLED